jgi:hypothetical protein
MHFTSFSIFDIHLNLFETELAAWRNLTGRDRFGRIKGFSHWIKRKWDDPDFPVPF